MDDPIAAADEAHVAAGSAMRRLFEALVQVEDRELWRDHGARDLAHWVQMRYGVSLWKAHRWLGAARALGSLPVLARALETGRLHVDKVCELARFATAETEADLVRWAQGVSVASIRRRGDAAVRIDPTELAEIERSRYLAMWFHDDGKRFAMEAELPAADGAVVQRAIRRVMEHLPADPSAADPAGARAADALVAMASSQIATDPDADRATVVIHAPLASLSGGAGAEVQDGPPVPASSLQRLLCTSRFQTVVEDASGAVSQLGELSRIAPAWMVRQVRYRDRGCTFPGCGTRAFTEAHHLRFWRDGGRTTLENLALICSFHHRSVHEGGWRVRRLTDGDLEWRTPSGVRWRGGRMARAPATAATA